jgi:hypothetical protein
MGLKFGKILLIIMAMVAQLSISVLFSHGQSVNYYYDDLNRLIRIDYEQQGVKSLLLTLSSKRS